MNWKRLCDFGSKQLNKVNAWIVRNLMHLLRSDDHEFERLEQPTIVFSPHQDDEVLGCGGMIILKRRLGTKVYIVFMTDGRASHKSRFISPMELAELRKKEARDCARSMGVPEENLIFLGFEDRFLCDHEIAAKKYVRQILDTISPSEVFVPFRREAPSDHQATYRIVRDALRESNGRHLSAIDLYEYFVWTPRLWFWKLRELYHLNTWLRVDTYEIRLLKQNALGCYRSQTTVLFPDPDWATIPKDLLAWSAMPYEYYLKNFGKEKSFENHCHTLSTRHASERGLRSCSGLQPAGKSGETPSFHSSGSSKTPWNNRN